jgi:hypothetical protein
VPTVHGDSASIYVQHRFGTSSARKPVAVRDFRLDLRWRNNQWLVVRDRTLRQS